MPKIFEFFLELHLITTDFHAENEAFAHYRCAMSMLSSTVYGNTFRMRQCCSLLLPLMSRFHKRIIRSTRRKCVIILGFRLVSTDLQVLKAFLNASSHFFIEVNFKVYSTIMLSNKVRSIPSILIPPTVIHLVSLTFCFSQKRR